MVRKKAKKDLEKIKENVIPIDMADANKQFFLNYGIAVTTDRAVPNVRDGLKPVQRRIIFAMHKLHLSPKSAFMKSQSVEGDVMGKYHPHAGSFGSIDYLTEKFVFPLSPIEGSGSFTDISGNAAAAPRYSEIRLSKYGAQMVEGLSEALVPFEDNYDNTKRLPKILPARLPYLLINGVKTGIAVGFRSAIAPHNPVDSLKLVKAYIKKPNMTLNAAIKIIQGPDLPTGGTLIGDIKKYYETGVGKLINQGVIIDDPEDKNQLIITEIPYNMGANANTYIDNVKDLIAKNKLKGILEINDYTNAEDNDNNKVHIEVLLSRNYDHETAKNLLFAKTDLQQTYSLNWMALDGKTPKVYSLMEYLKDYTDFQNKLAIREFKYIYNRDSERLEIVNGLLTVPKNLENIIYAAQHTSGFNQLSEVLQGKTKVRGLKYKFEYTLLQAEAIAKMRVYQLNKVDAGALKEEQTQLNASIYWANKYINDPDLRSQLLIERIDEVIKDLRKDGLDKRHTVLLDESHLKTYSEQDIISPVTVTIDKYGYIKTQEQKEINDEEVIQVIDTNDDDILCIFTNAGKMYQLPINKLKKYSGRDSSRGDAAFALLSQNGMTQDELILCYTTRKQLELEDNQIVMISKYGSAKRTITAGSKFITKTVRKSIDAWKPKFENDELIFIEMISTGAIENKANSITVISSEDTYKRIKLSDLNLVGATGAGSNTFVLDKELTMSNTCAIIVVENESYEYTLKDDTKVDLEKLKVLKPTIKFKPLK